MKYNKLRKLKKMSITMRRRIKIRKKRRLISKRLFRK
jgi:hypothetical protein